ncbi:AfsR/SARP family transcriptional regulator [Micromonospora sp. NPDC005215]|uniref:AfsR/SARP family transcriptional regulator n=1 Tax=Micromonospora sp. NPDC005215 TaxID=3157024 RepID=UPI0033A9AD13
MRYEVLGPLRVVDGQGVSSISAKKVETLLAVLLIQADQVVSQHDLVTAIWGESLPRRASAAMHVYVCQLRRFLNRPKNTAIVTRPPGYVLHLGDDVLDVNDLQRLVHEGRTLRRIGRHAEAAEKFRAGLSLWRGPAFDNLRDCHMIDRYATWLTELRLECMELFNDSNLAIGRHQELVGDLYTAIAQYPLREAFYRQLMLALYRSERRADALVVYQRAWETLDRELGLEPCRPLRELHQGILRSDGRLGTAGPRAERLTTAGLAS